MKNFTLYLKLALVPFRRSWFVLGLMVVSLAQLMLGLWYCGALLSEVRHTELHASQAKLITVQMKDGGAGVEEVTRAIDGLDASLEDWKSDEVLAKLEQEDPELIQTLRSVGEEGARLLPRLLVIRGVVPNEVVEKIRMMTEVSRVESSPVHHARLRSFYQHLGMEVRITLALLLLLSLVQLVVFHRIQSRDSSEVVMNLVSWGMSSVRARVPAFLAMVFLSTVAAFISVFEWFFFRQVVWKNNAFLGELSLDHTLRFPGPMIVLTFVVLMGAGGLLVFSGRAAEE